MKTLVFILTLLLLQVSYAKAQDNSVIRVVVSEKVETINGEKYYLHVVEKGQTLYSIAVAYNTPLNVIAKENNIENNVISVGQVLRIPFGEYFIHIVQKKETLFSISNLYVVPVKDIISLNPGAENGVKPKQNLKIPKTVIFSEQPKKNEKDNSPQILIDKHLKLKPYENEKDNSPQIKKQISFYNLEKLINDNVKKEFETWAQKSEFESSNVYQKRIADKDKKIEELKQKAINYYKNDFISKLDLKNFVIYPYDADYESYKIDLDKAGSFFLQVPLNKAQLFKQNKESLVFSDLDLLIYNNSWIISFVKIFNPADNSYFVYDITKQVNYNPQKYAVNINDIKVDVSNQLPANSFANKTEKVSSVNLVSDVDTNIFKTDAVNKKTFVLIISNENYKYVKKVKFALNDGKIFREYCIKMLGIPEDNVLYYPDATGNDIIIEISMFKNIIESNKGDAKIIFYYSGHGAPDFKTKEAYILPVDGSSENLETGIKLDYLYNELSAFKTQSVIVFLDACFSGSARDEKGMLADGRAALKTKPIPSLLKGNIIVFSATTGDQRAFPKKDKSHGMFTYYLLKKLQETKGNVSLKELSDYLRDQVWQESSKRGEEVQKPQVNPSPDVEKVWENWKIK